MGSLGKREKVLLIILGAVILFYIYFTLFLTPLQERMGAVKESINRYENDLQMIELSKGLIEKQQKSLEELQVKMTESLLILPDMERNPEIAYMLKKLADNSLTEINTISFGQATEHSLQEQNDRNTAAGDNASEEDNTPGTPSEGSGIYRVPVNIGITGNYSGVMNFIDLIENEKRLSQIESVSFSKNQGDGSLTATLTVNFYYSVNSNKGDIEYDFNDNRQDGKTELFR